VRPLRDNLTGYDTANVGLAEHPECALLTCDAGLAGVPGTGYEVDLTG
jgi:predicted nucleic acid-binding protein